MIQTNMGIIYWTLNQEQSENDRDSQIDANKIVENSLQSIDNNLENILPKLSASLYEKKILRFRHTTPNGTYDVVDFTETMPKSFDLYKIKVTQSAKFNLTFNLY